MIPKIIHLCWFGKDPYPVEIKVCLNSWKRILPDYQIRVWTYDDAKQAGFTFVDEALAVRKWAFAADVIRFYAVYQEGGLYMDSDIFLYRRPDELMEAKHFVTTGERLNPYMKTYGLQAAFFAGEKGNQYCKDMLDYYKDRHFKLANGKLDDTISPLIMAQVAEKYGLRYDDEYQDLGELEVYPTYYLSPYKRWNRHEKAIGQHRIYGSWKKRKLTRRVEIKLKHYGHVVRYALFRR